MGLRSILRDSSSRTGQFQPVVDATEQTPLPRDLRQAPQQELPEATRLLNRSKHGFDHLLSQTIATARASAVQADLHRVDSRPRDGLASANGRGLAVLLPTRGDISSHVAASQRLEIVLGAIPCIRRPLSSLSARVAPDGRQHRLELVRVARLVRQPLRADHLVIGIDGRLSVLALDESVLRLHDATVRIGEIARSWGVPRGFFPGRPRRGRFAW